MTSLVTVFGGSGFIGRHTVRALAKAGYRIRVAVRHPNLGNFLLPMGSVGQIQIVKTNIDDPDQIAAAVRGADAVVNLVGILFQSGHQRFEALHAEAAGAIAQAAKAAGAQALVHVSSIGADEESESAYARTKADGEARVRAAFPDATILRPSIVFGPEDNFFNRFAALARLAPALPLIGGGTTRFQPVYVSDVAAAILKCVQDPATHGQIYELGGPGIYSFKELMEFILRETGRKRLLVPIPVAIAMLQATFLQLLPNPLLTRDQVKLLKYDNVVSGGARGFAALGIQPDSLEAVVPAYLWRFRAEGQFAEFVQDKIGTVPK
ncbi:MAG: complex I NDUFA9 subunit family protein [Rhizomicrobium sp.]|jgi:NADH dehydrogenase